MENVQIHSRSYIVRWVHVGEGHSITWSVQPHKKSINFGIFKHPGTKNGPGPGPALAMDTAATLDAPAPPPTAHSNDVDFNDARRRRGSVSRNEASTVVDKLRGIGLRCVEWVGKCEADKVKAGTYDVEPGQDGMYGLVFDNTFSKQVSKTATFVLMTHPTDAPPKSKAQLKAQPSLPALGKPPPPRLASLSDEPRASDAAAAAAPLSPPPASPTKRRPTFVNSLEPANVHSGELYKRRRKKGQGYARRFFSLDFTSSTLSYYRDSHASALRGAVPLSLAAVGADEKTREFSVDSGAEVWHLRAANDKDFEEWKTALERASASAITTPAPSTPAALSASAPDPISSIEWIRAEEIAGRIAGSRDALRRLAQDTDVRGLEGAASPAASSVDSSQNPFFVEGDAGSPPSERLPFWKRKASTGGSPSPAVYQRKLSSQQLTVPAPGSGPSSGTPSPATNPPEASYPVPPLPMHEVHNRCLALLRDLDNVVSDFSVLLAASKTRRLPPAPLTHNPSRMSIDSIASQEFFDAEENGGDGPSQLLSIRRSSDQDQDEDRDFQDMDSDAGDSEASSDAGESAKSATGNASAALSGSSLFPVKPVSLSPPPPEVRYRSTVSPPKQPPPSLVGFLRKNAGKDLSTVSMPVTANEPLSALQRLAEPFEAADVLHKAAAPALSSPDKAMDRLVYVSAFAISNFAANRQKERAIRKPFNPMLGETYELIRGDLGFRFVSEKVCHRPVRMAYQADALDGAWSLSQSQQPTQKFWGKSAELNTEGKVRLVLHSVNGEKYSWTLATCFLRNVIAGEKYIEPVQSMTVFNETTGMKAVATFKAGGMFSGRSEDVSVAFYDASSSTPSSVAMDGKWTTSLSRTDTSEVVWAAASMVPDAAKVYGFTSFAAVLNQITEADKKALPPTDSRLRPDQRALEEGKSDEAEALKAKLEERQRARRKLMEDHGVEWKPRFFELVKGDQEEEVWGLNVGKSGYWECREKSNWHDVTRVFET